MEATLASTIINHSANSRGARTKARDSGGCKRFTKFAEGQSEGSLFRRVGGVARVTTRILPGSAASSSSAAPAPVISTGASAVRRRLQRSDSRATLIADGAAFARRLLGDIARIPRPVYSPIDAMLYGAFIDIAICLRLPVGGPLTRCMVRNGGPENVRFMLTLALFDKNRDGDIDEEEVLASSHLL